MSTRSKRQHGMAFTGFYMNPEEQPHYNYEAPNNHQVPETLPPVDQLAQVEGSTEINEVVPQVPQEEIPQSFDTKKRTPEPKPDSEEDDDEDNSWPMMMKGKGKGQPSFSFFPIMFGGAGLGRSGVPASGAVAIANSFSTGRKGIAMSNAVANGDPTAFRNRNLKD